MMAKRLARVLFANGLRASTLLARAERRHRGRLTILCYHRILPEELKKKYFLPDLVVTPESFRRHCSFLSRRYCVYPLSRGVEILKEPEGRNQRLAAITFDDGYADNDRFAVPILAEFGLPATFFVVTDLVGTDRLTWYDRMGKAVGRLSAQGRSEWVVETLRSFGREPARTQGDGSVEARTVGHAKNLAPLQRRVLLERFCAEAGFGGVAGSDDLMMDWNQLTRLADAGHEIGSHSRTHEMLTQLGEAGLRDEIAGSRRELQSRLGRPVRSFCYPNGDVNDQAAKLVAQAGYDCAVGVETGTNGGEADFYRLRRIFIHESRLIGLNGLASETLMRTALVGGPKRLAHSPALEASET
jgi:peptidoglycan/xylan/chitin deacetylase (PgdA/CDA1 family)